MRKIAFLSLATIVLAILSVVTDKNLVRNTNPETVTSKKHETSIPFVSKPSPTPTPLPIPSSYEIPLRTHSFQRFNNCGPSSLSMALSYFDVNISQVELGLELRPYQVANGDNDDKSVTLAELRGKAEELGFEAYHRPNGNIEMLKQFISQDIPVVARTLTKKGEDIGHFRLVRGYTQTHLIQDDSLQGKNLTYTFSEFNDLWQQFVYEYMVIVPKEKVAIAKQILGEDIDEMLAWQKTVAASEKILNSDPNNFNARFNLSVALYNVGNYKRSVQEFEKVESRLTFRTLWYQIEPIRSYYELGNYDRVFQLTDNILNNENRAFSELYIIRGDIYKNQGNLDAARSEYEKAVFYNVNLTEAKTKLASVQN